jgi:hypothetical protein
MHGWHGPDLLADVRKLGFLPAQYYDEILAQDVLEHLPRTDTLRTLAHWNRPLRMGGTILVRVPNVLGVAALLVRPENQDLAKQEELILCLFGTQAYTGDFHFTSFTPSLLEGYPGRGRLSRRPDGPARRVAPRRRRGEGVAHRVVGSARLREVANSAG